MYPLKKINFRCTTKKIIQKIGARNVATIKRFKICYSKFLQFNLIKDMHSTYFVKVSFTLLRYLKHIWQNNLTTFFLMHELQII